MAHSEEELAVLTCGSPPHRQSAKAAAQPKPTGFATGTATAAVELLDEAVGAIEGAGGAAGAALKPIGSSNIWARSDNNNQELRWARRG